MSDHAHQPQTSTGAAPAPKHGHDFAAANKAYFDEHADKVEEMHPEWRAASRKQVEAMRAEWPALFDKDCTAALDFACGIGASSSSPRQ